MRFGFFFSRSVFVGVLVTLTLSVIPISGANGSTGVNVGEWVKYEVVGTIPSLFDYDWVRLEIQNVNGTEITILETIRYKNGAEEPNTLSWDIDTGVEPWVIPANLNKGDPFPFIYNTAVVNDTLTQTYAGASRAVNLLYLSRFEEYTELTAYWDQATGFLLEVSLNYTSPTESWTGGYKALETKK